jgi:CheY-like chemotaxis protein
VSFAAFVIIFTADETFPAMPSPGGPRRAGVVDDNAELTYDESYCWRQHPRAMQVTRGTPSLLVVEDDVDMATTLAEIAMQEGFHVVCAGNGREALEILESTQPTLMLVDLFMPVMGGAEFLRRVKATPRLADIPRIIVTAANDPMIPVREDAMVLYKPLDLNALTSLLQKYGQERSGSAE